MSRCMYAGKRLIPAPLVSLTKQYQSTEDGTKIGSSWNISINGTLVSHMGSPNVAGTFWTSGGFPPDDNVDSNAKLAAVIRKTEAVRKLFSEDGNVLEFQSENGSQPLKCNPVIQSISFSEGPWTDRVQYSISLTANIIYVNGTALGEDSFSEQIESASENWQIDSNDEPVSEADSRTYKVTHTVSAKGKRLFNSAGTLVMPAWQQAKAWVSPKLGFSSAIISGSSIANLSAGAYNHLRNESTDEYNGSYSVTEMWLLASANALETYEVSVVKSVADGLTKASINGNVIGLNSGSGSKLSNAQAKFSSVKGSIFGRVNNHNLLNNETLNPEPLSDSISTSPVTGTISYSREYDNRRTNMVYGSLSETITISDSLPTDFCVPIFVLGRAKGPILQSLRTSKEQTRSVSIEVVVPATMSTTPSKPDSQVKGIADGYEPQGSSVFVQDKNESWDVKSGRYSYNITWIWEV